MLPSFVDFVDWIVRIKLLAVMGEVRVGLSCNLVCR